MRASFELTATPTGPQNDRPGSSTSHRQASERTSTQDVEHISRRQPSDGIPAPDLVRNLYGSRPADQPGSRTATLESNQSGPAPLRRTRPFGDSSAQGAHGQAFDRSWAREVVYRSRPADWHDPLSPASGSNQQDSRTLSEPQRLVEHSSHVAEASRRTQQAISPLDRPALLVEQSSVVEESVTSSARPINAGGIWTPSSDIITPSSGERGSNLRYLSGPAHRLEDIIEPAPEAASILPGDASTSRRLADQARDEGAEALLKALGITEHRPLGIAEVKEYAQIIMDVAKTGGNEQDLLRRLSEKSTQISRERDQANNRDVETLLKALGFRDDDLGSGNYLEARKHAQTIVRVIRTDGQDQEFNDASAALLKLAPKRFWLRSLVNPRKDTIDWYNASWRNQHAMSKLDTTTWGGSIRKLFYQANQPIAGLTNTRSGNLGFIGLQAVLGTAYTSYIEKKFALSTLIASVEYSATARYFYTKVPGPLNQGMDTIQFQAASIALYEFLQRLMSSHAQNATTGG